MGRLIRLNADNNPAYKSQKCMDNSATFICEVEITEIVPQERTVHPKHLSEGSITFRKQKGIELNESGYYLVDEENNLLFIVNLPEAERIKGTVNGVILKTMDLNENTYLRNV